MALETLTTFDSVLKIDYLPVIQAQLQKELVLYNRIKRDRENVVGKIYYFPVHSAWGETAGAIAESDTVPASQVETTLNAQGPVRSVFGRFEVTSKVIHATKNDRGAFVQAVDFKMRAVTENLKKDLNRMLYSDSSGALAQITSGAATTSITLGAQSGNALPVRPNMVLQSWSARSGGTQRVGGGATNTVVDVNYDTNVATMSAAWSDGVNNDFVFKSTGRGINVMGLLGIVDDGTYVGTFQNIARASNSFWKSSVLANGGTLRDLSFVLIQQAEDKAYQKGGGNVTLYVSNLGQRANYQALAITDKRYINTMKFDQGFEALEYNGKPWFVDRDCDKNTLFALDESVVRFALLQDIDWFDFDGAILHRSNTNLSYFAILEGHFELITYQPNRHVVIRDLNEPAGY